MRSEKEALSLVVVLVLFCVFLFLSLSEKARSDPVLWLICMQSKYCSSPDTVKSDWGTFHTWGCYGIRFLGPWVILVTMNWRAEPCALYPLPSPLRWAVIISAVQKKIPLSAGSEVWLPVLLWRLSLLTCFRIAPVYPGIWSFSKPCSFVTWLALLHDSILL